MVASSAAGGAIFAAGMAVRGDYALPLAVLAGVLWFVGWLAIAPRAFTRPSPTDTPDTDSRPHG